MSRSRDRAPRIAARALLLAGVVQLAYGGYVVLDSSVYDAIAHERLEEARERTRVAQPAIQGLVTATAIRDGTAIGEIHIPRIGLTAIVAEGESPAVLRRAVGHLADTALPWGSGNVVLAGHRDTVFRPLKGIHAGDAITLRTQYGDVEYRVEWTAVVPPTEVGVLRSTGRSTLTLITCFPFSYLGPAPERFVVRAREVSRYGWPTENRTTLRR